MSKSKGMSQEAIAAAEAEADELYALMRPGFEAQFPPTDNLEAGAGDLVAVAWRYCSHDINGDPWPWVYTETKPAAHAEVEPLYSAAQLAAVTAENARLTRERDEARTLVTEANNSLYGSQGYFHSLNGGAFDKYHLASGIEALKESSRKAYLAEAENARLRERIEQAYKAGFDFAMLTEASK